MMIASFGLWAGLGRVSVLSFSRWLAGATFTVSLAGLMTHRKWTALLTSTQGRDNVRSQMRLWGRLDSQANQDVLPTVQ